MHQNLSIIPLVFSTRSVWIVLLDVMNVSVCSSVPDDEPLLESARPIVSPNGKRKLSEVVQQCKKEVDSARIENADAVDLLAIPQRSGDKFEF